MFTADPSTGDRDRIVIEGAFGLGEVVVVRPGRARHLRRRQGRARGSCRVRDRPQDAQARPRRRTARSQRVELDAERGRRPGADRRRGDRRWPASGLRGRGALRRSPRTSSGRSRDGETFLVQSRPITTLGTAPTVRRRPPRRRRRPLLLQGLAASPGVGQRARCGCCARRRTATSSQDGEVLVAPMTNPDWVPTMRRAAAVVTDGGGMTCHAAIVARELGVPCVVGARTATAILRDGELVTVDGARGAVYEGAVARHAGRRARRRRGSRRRRGAVEPLGHPALRQPRDGRARRGGRRAARRRRRPAAGRVHAHRRARRRAPPGAARPRRAGGVPRRAWRRRCCASPGRSRRGRSCTGRSTSARTSSAASRAATEFEPVEEQPDDRLPRAATATSASPTCSRSSWSCSPGCARRRRTCT